MAINIYIKSSPIVLRIWEDRFFRRALTFRLNVAPIIPIMAPSIICQLLGVVFSKMNVSILCSGVIPISPIMRMESHSCWRVLGSRVVIATRVQIGLAELKKANQSRNDNAKNPNNFLNEASPKISGKNSKSLSLKSFKIISMGMNNFFNCLRSERKFGI